MVLSPWQLAAIGCQSRRARTGWTSAFLTLSDTQLQRSLPLKQEFFPGHTSWKKQPWELFLLQLWNEDSTLGECQGLPTAPAPQHIQLLKQECQPEVYTVRALEKKQYLKALTFSSTWTSVKGESFKSRGSYGKQQPGKGTEPCRLWAPAW